MSSREIAQLISDLEQSSETPY